jgi:cell division protein FtsW
MSTTVDQIAGRRFLRSPGLFRKARAATAGLSSGQLARPTGYVLLLTIVVVLNIVGILMVLSASSVKSILSHGSAWYYFERQVTWLAIGAVALIVGARIDYRHWRRVVLPLLTLATALLVVVLVPGVGHTAFGSRRWLGFGALSIQPSELGKLALLIYGAEVLSRRTDAARTWKLSLRPVAGVFLVFAALVMKEPDMGTTIVLAIIAGTLLFVGGIRGRHLAGIGAGVALGATFLAVAEPYRRARLLSFLHPVADRMNGGWQVYQSLIAISSGRLVGVGLGAGRSKWQFLPNAHTDFIFAVIAEELGFVGCLLVVGLFAAFAVFGVRAAVRAPDRFGMLVAAGITGWVVGQAIVNMGAVIGLLPVTGVPLPFVSFGGSALLFTMGAAGILLNVARQGRD